MEDYEIINEKGETPNLTELKEIHIKNNGKDYCLNLRFTDKKIKFSINDNEEMISMKYVREMNLKEIKGLNKVFYYINSFYDFYAYLQKLKANNKLNIKKNDKQISLLIMSEILLKPQTIVIDLFLTKDELAVNREKIIQEFKKINEKIEKNKSNNYIIFIYILPIIILFLLLLIRIIYINDLKSEIIELKKKNNDLVSLINNVKLEIIESIFVKKEQNTDIKSVILKKTEQNMLISFIEYIINKRIKFIKKLYQATIDGGNPRVFHNKCDNISNTLVFIKSKGKRRFGGFTPIPWQSEKRGYKEDFDKKSFVFSLDEQKIYLLKETNYSVYHHKDYGPCFGSSDIEILGNPLEKNCLRTRKSSYKYENFKELSEFQYPNEGKALEYEVFQVIFY